jgi:16S rRNA (guanine1207-N2)-methyltransferase
VPQPGGHYFDADPGVASRPRTVRVTLPDVTFDAAADAGVFSAGALDTGTRLLLLDGPPPPPGAHHLLDLGCGWGPIALTLARRAPGATVWAVDVNERAVELCARNAREAGLGNVRPLLVPADDPLAGLPAEVALDGIWSNPPIRVGKPALHALLGAALARLAPGASAHLVVQRHLGADSLARWLTEQGHRCERRTSRAGYRLLDVTVAGPA